MGTEVLASHRGIDVGGLDDAGESMSKYYYTDPLAAAWMAKHFGMKFYEFFPESDVAMIRWKNKLCVVDKIYIHPDSLHLLEPKIQDLAIMPCEGGGTCFITFNRDKDLMAVKKRSYMIHIIYRNGIPFMWPESEV